MRWTKILPDTAAQMLNQFAELARVRAPSLADVGIAKHVVASVDMGGDGHPYLGLVEDGLWMLAGFGGHGVMHGPPRRRNCWRG